MANANGEPITIVQDDQQRDVIVLEDTNARQFLRTEVQQQNAVLEKTRNERDLLVEERDNVSAYLQDLNARILEKNDLITTTRALRDENVAFLQAKGDDV